MVFLSRSPIIFGAPFINPSPTTPPSCTKMISPVVWLWYITRPALLFECLLLNSSDRLLPVEECTHSPDTTMGSLVFSRNVSPLTTFLKDALPIVESLIRFLDFSDNGVAFLLTLLISSLKYFLEISNSTDRFSSGWCIFVFDITLRIILNANQAFPP